MKKQLLIGLVAVAALAGASTMKAPIVGHKNGVAITSGLVAEYSDHITKAKKHAKLEKAHRELKNAHLIKSVQLIKQIKGTSGKLGRVIGRTDPVMWGPGNDTIHNDVMHSEIKRMPAWRQIHGTDCPECG